MAVAIFQRGSPAYEVALAVGDEAVEPAFFRRVVGTELAEEMTLTLFALPSARLVSDEAVLSPADVLALDREVRILNANIQELRPHLPHGFVVGMALGFSSAVLLFPGIPVLIVAATSGFATSTALLVLGGVLTGLGGLGLLAALICLVLGNDAESAMADERAQLVEKRDALVKRQTVGKARWIC